MRSLVRPNVNPGDLLDEVITDAPVASRVRRRARLRETDSQRRVACRWNRSPVEKVFVAAGRAEVIEDPLEAVRVLEGRGGTVRVIRMDCEEQRPILVHRLRLAKYRHISERQVAVISVPV